MTMLNSTNRQGLAAVSIALLTLLSFFTGCAAEGDTCPPSPPNAVLWQKLNDEAEQAFNDNSFGVAEMVFAKALEEADKQHCEVERARSLNSLGVLKQAQKKFSDGEKYLTEALSIRERLLGEKHQCVVATLIDLSALYEDEGKTSKAESTLLRALKSCEAAGENDVQYAVVLNNLGSLCYALHKKDDAQKYLKLALYSYRKIRPDDPQVRAIMQILLNLFQSAHQYDDFRSLYVEFAKGNPNANSKSLSKAAHVMAKQADELAAAGLLADAETMYNRSLALFEASAQEQSADCKSVRAAYLNFQRLAKESEDRLESSHSD